MLLSTELCDSTASPYNMHIAELVFAECKENKLTQKCQANLNNYSERNYK
jgi:hypothetical protein